MAGTTQKVKRNWGKTIAQHLSNSVLDPLFAFYTQINNLVTDVETNRRVLNVNTTVVGNVGAGEDDLATYAMPASKIVQTGAGVRIRASGKTANNATAKTLKMYFGTAVIVNQSLTVSQAGTWYIEAEVIRTGLSAQDFVARMNEGVGTTLAAGKQAVLFGTATETETATITIKVTGTAGADNDITQEHMVVEFVPAAADLVASALSDVL